MDKANKKNMTTCKKDESCMFSYIFNKIKSIFSPCKSSCNTSCSDDMPKKANLTISNKKAVKKTVAKAASKVVKIEDKAKKPVATKKKEKTVKAKKAVNKAAPKSKKK